MSRGITLDLAFNIFVLVALYALVIDFKHLFCNERGFVASPSPLAFMSLGECHTAAP